MRYPIRKAGICFAVTILGLALVLLGVAGYKPLGDVVQIIMWVAGLLLAIISFFFLAWAVFASIGYARLLAGKGVIARWHVSPAEWDRFRAFDALRAAQDLSLRNDLRIRKVTPPRGVDVIVGRRQLIVDGAYHALRSWSHPFLRGVNWAPAPADPECLEFTVEYPPGRYNSRFKLTLRVPVPAQALSEGLRVFEHYQALLSQPKR